MLNADQRQRLSLLRTMIEVSRGEAIDALEKNYWDSSMALEWLKAKEENPDASLEEFHAKYEEARKKSFVLPQDRYDTPTSGGNAAPANRQARRAAKKNKNKKK